MRFYNNIYPDVDDIVICRVKKFKMMPYMYHC